MDRSSSPAADTGPTTASNPVFEYRSMLRFKLYPEFEQGMAETLEPYALHCERGKILESGADVWLVVFDRDATGAPVRYVVLEDVGPSWSATAFGFAPKVKDGKTFKVPVSTDPDTEGLDNSAGRGHGAIAGAYGSRVALAFAQAVCPQLLPRRSRRRRRRRY